MSILNYNLNVDYNGGCEVFDESRCRRHLPSDLKNGIELIIDFKKKVDSLHPVASEAIIKLLLC